jgi:hypothetical protein
MSTSSRSPVSRFNRTMGWKVCGATFQLGQRRAIDSEVLGNALLV